MKDKIYWTMKNGTKIDIDDMTEEHLKNVLKMIVLNRKANEYRGDEPEPYAYDYQYK